MSLLDLFRPPMRPAFLIIGAQKAGTSALFRMIAAHQQVAAPVVKEHHFFDNDLHYARGMRHYLSGFPRKGPATRGRITFEATPNYLFNEASCERIHRELPGVRLIVVLRDPVSRAFSAWNMFRDFANSERFAHLHDPRSFEQAVEDELAGRTAMRAHRYLARGHYAPQLRRFIDRFGRDRILVLEHRRLDRDPAGVMAACCSFLGLEPYAGDPGRLRVRDNVRPYTAGMDPALRERLEAYFAPHMAELVDLLGPEWDLLKSLH
jgi:hypothetical protein